MRYRWMYKETGLPGWMRYGGRPGRPHCLGIGPWWAGAPVADEVSTLKDLQARLRERLAWVEQRLGDLGEAQKPEKGG